MINYVGGVIGLTGTSSRGDSSESIFNRVGDPVTLECRFRELVGSGVPTVIWYKLNDRGGRQKLFTYDGNTGIATEVCTAASDRTTKRNLDSNYRFKSNNAYYEESTGRTWRLLITNAFI